MTESARPPRQEQEPPGEDITEPAPGILRLQLPVNLPGLGHVNCYLLEDERGIAVIDPGLPGDDAWGALERGLRRAGFELRHVHTAVITHSHHDHFGASGRLAEELGAAILTHAAFAAPNFEFSGSDETQPFVDDDEIERRIDSIFSRPLPWGTERVRPTPAALAHFKAMGRFGGPWASVPTPSIRVADSQVVTLGRREWLAVHTPGHTEDHLCLWSPELAVMFSGDHVLPSITPHIGGMTSQPDPLADFFSSLTRMTHFPDVKVVLPAHGHPFVDLAGRSDAIKEHHEHRLDVVQESAVKLGDGTVTQYMRLLFSERVWGDMAESETYAHLEHLRLKGHVRRTDRAGVAHYSSL